MKNVSRLIFLLLGIIGFLSVQIVAAQARSFWDRETPDVLVTIKPLYAWVSAVMEGIKEPSLLIQGSDSVHNYSLRPSDARMLSRASIIFMVDDDMEVYLKRPLKTLASGAKIIELAEAPGITSLKPRVGGLFEAHRHDHHDSYKDDGRYNREDYDDYYNRYDDDRPSHHHHHHHHHHHDDDLDEDLHFWLDPDNAIAATRYIADVLSKYDSRNSAKYQRNAWRYIQKINRLKFTIDRKLAPYKGLDFIVFHDAYHYFENRFDMRAIGSITIDPERQPSARRIRQIRRKIVDSQAVCVFSEPQFRPTIVDRLIEGTKAKAGVLDPLGVDLKAGENSYEQLLLNITNSFIECGKQIKRR